VVTTTVLSGVLAVAAAEWAGSGRSLGSPVGVLWTVVAVLGVAAMALGLGLERRLAGTAESLRDPGSS
jgi:hypothetical protein